MILPSRYVRALHELFAEISASDQTLLPNFTIEYFLGANASYKRSKNITDHNLYLNDKKLFRHEFGSQEQAFEDQIAGRRQRSIVWTRNVFMNAGKVAVPRKHSRQLTKN